MVYPTTVPLNNTIYEGISVLIINYNSSSNSNILIRSLRVINSSIDEIIIVDNNSMDINELRLNSKTNLYKNKTNYGFAKAANMGIKASKNKIILLINPDCFLENNSILKSLKIISNNIKIGAIGGKIKKANSNKYHLTANSKPNFLTGLFEFTNLKKIFPNNLVIS
jgi:hypothetical protein